MSRQDWRFVVQPSGRPGAENMALDHSLLRAAREGVSFLRLYGWDPPCLSFGRNEPALTRYDPKAIERLGLSTVRRPTGGRAVWHQAEVTYAVAGPADLFGSLKQAYIRVHEVLAAALGKLGVDAELAASARGRTLRPGSGACFAAPVGGEVVVRGRKLVGSAQFRERGAFLQHGSILLEDGQNVVAEVMRGAGAGPLATSMSAVLGRAVAFEDVADAVASEARRAWDGEWKPIEVEPLREDVARYEDPEWTWRR